MIKPSALASADILITGGIGFIGSSLARRLVHAGASLGLRHRSRLPRSNRVRDDPRNQGDGLYPGEPVTQGAFP